jgi:hypothetical protein
MKIAWIPIQSTAISAAAYEGSSLYIRFITHREYEYLHVPKSVYEKLIRASSKGQYLNASIKPFFKFREIS